MTLVLRAIAILINPAAEWVRIEKESGDPIYLMTRYVALLAVIPAVFGFIGACVIGVIVPGAGPVRASLFDGIFGAIFGYLEALVIIAVLGLIIAALAPLFGGRRDFAGGLRLAAYSYTPVWLAGIFLLLPGLRFLMLTGFYGAYILMLGLPLVTKAPAERSLKLTVLIVVCAGVLTLLAGAAQRNLFPGAAPI
jgi:hypothetical protein